MADLLVLLLALTLPPPLSPMALPSELMVSIAYMKVNISVPWTEVSAR